MDLNPYNPEKMDGTIQPDGSFITGSGEHLHNIHSASQCKGDHCPIHNPSPHSMRGFPTSWINGYMWRVCPHSMTHPDPDGPAYARVAHLCDGCCK